MNAFRSIRFPAAILLLSISTFEIPANLVLGGEWQKSSKSDSTGKWAARLVSDQRPAPDSSLDSAADSSPDPDASQKIESAEPRFLAPVTVESDQSSAGPGDDALQAGTASVAETAAVTPDDAETEAMAPSPAPPHSAPPHSAPPHSAPPQSEGGSAIVLEGPDDPWRPELPFEQSSTSWILRGSKTHGLGMFSLEGGGNRSVRFEPIDDIQDATRFEGNFEASIHWLSGPGRTDMPPRLFDLMYNVHLIHALGSSVGIDANFDLGLYTDFEDSVRDGWRFPGRVVLYSDYDEATQFVVGMEYIDTDIVQLLPAGGVVLTPDDRTRLELYFPRPSARFLIDDALEEQNWLYLSGEYQARAWAVERTTGNADVASLNEYRVSLGVETLSKIEGVRNTFSEISWLFHRELQYRSGVGNYEPDDTLMFRVGSRF